ncbi:MAG: hypothetical protein LQ341_007795, partial [Variospora aurantia]
TENDSPTVYTEDKGKDKMPNRQETVASLVQPLPLIPIPDDPYEPMLALQAEFKVAADRYKEQTMKTKTLVQTCERLDALFFMMSKRINVAANKKEPSDLARSIKTIVQNMTEGRVKIADALKTQPDIIPMIFQYTDTNEPREELKRWLANGEEDLFLHRRRKGGKVARGGF